MKITHYLRPSLITFFDVTTRDEAIDSLIQLVDQAGKLTERDRFRQTIFDREQLVSTGIGLGVAIPHGKLKSFREFFIAVGIQQKKGIEWDAIDQAPVHFVFLVGGPDNRQSEYLKILSHLTAAIKDSELRRELMMSSSPESVIRAFS